MAYFISSHCGPGPVIQPKFSGNRHELWDALRPRPSSALGAKSRLGRFVWKEARPDGKGSDATQRSGFPRPRAWPRRETRWALRLDPAPRDASCPVVEGGLLHGRARSRRRVTAVGLQVRLDPERTRSPLVGATATGRGPDAGAKCGCADVTAVPGQWKDTFLDSSCRQATYREKHVGRPLLETLRRNQRTDAERPLPDGRAVGSSAVPADARPRVL